MAHFYCWCQEKCVSQKIEKVIKYSFLHLWPQVYLTLIFFLQIRYSDSIIPNIFYISG